MAVAGDFLVQDLVTQIRAHVVLSDEAALVTALWILLAWCHEAAVHSPILLVTSPEKALAMRHTPLLKYAASVGPLGSKEPTTGTLTFTPGW